MCILGVDPGSRITGYGIVENVNGRLIHVAHGAIKTEGGPFPSRLLKIQEGLLGLFEEHSPHVMAVEEAFSARNVQSALKLGQVRGVVLLTAALQKVEIFEYSPMEIKKALTGYGRAEKEQIRYMVCELLKLDRVLSLDASDALAVAICHAHVGQFCRRLP
jgi:crossover junction endodeoxyribonuclease RuvC